MEIQIEQNPAEDRGGNEDEEDFVGVVVNPAVQLRLTGDPDRMFIGLKRFDDCPLDFVKDASVVESPFDEVGFDEQRLAVERDELAVNRVGVVANLFDFFDFFIGLRRAAHDGWRGDRPAEHGEIPGRAVTDRGDLVMVHAGHPIHRLSHVEDLFEYFFGEDITLFDVEHDVDVIGTAKLVGKLEMHLHEGMPVRAADR